MRKTGDSPAAYASPAIRWIDWLPITLLILLFAVGMLVSYPTYDDTLIEILLQEKGAVGLRNGHLDRPVYGYTLSWLAGYNVLWPAFIFFNCVGWLIVGSSAIAIFRRLMPGEDQLAIIAGVLAISPILVESQFLIVSGLIFPISLCHLAAIILLSRKSSFFGEFYKLAASVALIVVSILYSEYGVAATLPLIMLLICEGFTGLLAERRRVSLVDAAIMAAATMFAYAVFRSIMDASFRGGVTESGLLADGFFRLVKLPFRYLSAMWTAVVGGLATELGQVNVNDYEHIAAFILGVILAAICWLAMRSLATRSGFDDIATRSAALYPAFVLVVSVSVGLMPFLVMGRRPNDVDMSSRFFTPVLPYVACLSVCLLRRLTAVRIRQGFIALLLFLAFYTTVAKVMIARSDMRTITQWGDQLRQRLAPLGTTVAVIPATQPFLRWNLADDELTSRLSLKWKKDSRQRFWATPQLDVLGPSSSSAMRGAHRALPPSRVLICQPGPTGLTIANVEVPNSAP